MIMIEGLLPYLNMDVIRKMTFYIFIGHERQKLFWGIIIFIRRVPPSNLVVVTFLLTSLRKGYFLCRWLKRYRLLMADIAVLMFFFFFFLVFFIRWHASSQISMQNRFVYCGWVSDFRRIMLAFVTATSPLRTSVPLQSICGRQWINAMFNCHSNFNL